MGGYSSKNTASKTKVILAGSEYSNMEGVLGQIAAKTGKSAVLTHGIGLFVQETDFAGMHIVSWFVGGRSPVS